MIDLIKKYYKWGLAIVFILLIGLGYYLYYINNDSLKINKKDKMVPLKEKSNIKKSANTVFIDVKGAVNAPGVYEMDSNKRIIDAINLAGGLLDKADTVNINLSKKVKDEMFIIVYTKQEIYNFKKNKENKEVVCASVECICPDSNNEACISEGKTIQNKNSKVSINSGTKEDLMTLTGIGESKAEAIIKYRQENGSFSSIEDIKNVSGIGDAMYEKIKDNIIL